MNDFSTLFLPITVHLDPDIKRETLELNDTIIRLPNAHLQTIPLKDKGMNIKRHEKKKTTSQYPSST